MLNRNNAIIQRSENLADANLVVVVFALKILHVFNIKAVNYFACEQLGIDITNVTVFIQIEVAVL